MSYIWFSPKWKHIGGGAYGQYYRMSPKRGIKLIPKMEEETFSKWVERVNKEFQLLKRAATTKHAPMPYSIVAVDGHGSLKYGIIMEHLDARRFSDLPYSYIEKLKLNTSVERHIDKILRSAGIKHGDLHTGNILATVKRGKITRLYAVDFSPACSKFI